MCPTPPTMHAGRAFRVALVMIVRDEARHIARALASVMPHVDEALVLDTGSTDDTVALALAAGARVAHFEWVNDFSAARNAALDAAGADWHVVLDADERLSEGGAALAALRHTPPDHVGALRIDSLDDGGSTVQCASSWISRVLPGHLRYAGRVHEQPQHGLPVRRLQVVITHDGYLQEALAAKAGRNRALLEHEVAEQPHSAYAWYQLGKDHDAYGRHADALQAFAYAQTLLADQGQDPAWLHDLVVRSLHAHKCLGHHENALLHAEAGLARWAGSPDFFFALGDLLLDWAAEEPRRAEELLPMIESAWQRCLVIGERPDLEGAVAGRGSHLAAHNLALLYASLGREADAAEYRRLADEPAEYRRLADEPAECRLLADPVEHERLAPPAAMAA